MIGQFKGRQKTNVYGWVSDLAVARSGFNQIDISKNTPKITTTTKCLQCLQFYNGPTNHKDLNHVSIVS